MAILIPVILTVVISISSARILSTNDNTERYKCYHWTDEDYETINFGGWKVENERRMCEDHYHFVFTQGQDWKAPGCGTCWCCQPDTPQVSTLSHYNSFLEETTETALKKEGESCGSCFCPPTYTAGDCAPGLECKHDPMIPDRAGKCVRPGQASKCQDERSWCRLTTIDCRLTTVAQKCQKTCNAC